MYARYSLYAVSMFYDIGPCTEIGDVRLTGLLAKTRDIAEDQPSTPSITEWSTE